MASMQNAGLEIEPEAPAPPTFEESFVVVDQDGGDPLESFLVDNKLQEFLPTFQEQQIDFETLMILTEEDIKGLGLPLGPFRKLWIALKNKKAGNSTFDSTADLTNTSAIEGNETAPHLDDDDNVSVKSDQETKKVKFEDLPRDPLHPYYHELKEFVPCIQKLAQPSLEDLVEFEKKPSEWVNSPKKLKSIIKQLRQEKLLSIEFKSTDSHYESRMNVMQISTLTDDYVIDFLKMKECVLYLSDIMSNPNILKLFWDTSVLVRLLQSQWFLFPVNIFSVKFASKALNTGLTSLVSLLGKNSSWTKPNVVERPMRKDIITNLRKESHIMLKTYLEYKPQLTESGKLQEIYEKSNKVCLVLFHPRSVRGPASFFGDYDKFNDQQKSAAEKIHNWREATAKNADVSILTVMPTRLFRTICLCLPNKEKDLLSLAGITKYMNQYHQKIVSITRDARKEWESSPKNDEKYDLHELPKSKETDRSVRGNPRAAAQKPSRNAAQARIQARSAAQPLNAPQPRAAQKRKSAAPSPNAPRSKHFKKPLFSSPRSANSSYGSSYLQKPDSGINTGGGAYSQQLGPRPVPPPFKGYTPQPQGQIWSNQGQWFGSSQPNAYNGGGQGQGYKYY